MKSGNIVQSLQFRMASSARGLHLYSTVQCCIFITFFRFKQFKSWSLFFSGYLVFFFFIALLILEFCSILSLMYYFSITQNWLLQSNFFLRYVLVKNSFVTFSCLAFSLQISILFSLLQTRAPPESCCLFAALPSFITTILIISSECFSLVHQFSL